MVKRCGRPTKTRGNCRIEIAAEDPCCQQHATAEELTTVFASRIAGRAQRQAAYNERQSRFEQDRQRLRDEAANAAGDVARITEELSREIPAGAPPPLVTDWRKQAARELKLALARERALGDTQAADAAIARAKGAARHIVPSIGKAARAAAQGHGVLEMHGRGHWAAGWLYWLTGKSTRPAGQELTSATVTALTSWLEQEAAHNAAIRAVAGGDAITTAQTTRGLTHAMVRAAAREAKPYRELTVPVLCGAGYGRLDVVIWHPAFPDVVIEIDSAHNPGSAKKLAFARDAGAIPVWVRFGTGRADAPEGVTVIDLRED